MPNNKAPETGEWVCGVWCWRATGFCVVRPFPGGRHGHAARRAGRDRGASGARSSGARASGAGDAVNGKYEKKTVTLDAPRYQVVLVDFEIQMTMIVVVAVIMRF